MRRSATCMQPSAVSAYLSSKTIHPHLLLPTDKEIEIIHDLGQRVLAFEDVLSQLSDVIGELDR